MINKTDGINMIVKIFIEKILFELRGSVSNYPPRLELPRLTVPGNIIFYPWWICGLTVFLRKAVLLRKKLTVF